MSLEEEFSPYLNSSIHDASNLELYEAMNAFVRDKAAQLPRIQGNRKLYYISAEFLIGRQLGKNLINLNMYKGFRSLLERNGKSLEEVEACEKEPSLGNGGLGRLAACFLDSIATLDMCGDGIGLRYHLGLFKQKFKDHKQEARPDTWLDGENMFRESSLTFPVEMAGRTYYSHMYDLDVIGYKGGRNRLHLFDLDTIDESIVRRRDCHFDRKDISRGLTLFLYPDDSDREGQLLRIYQEYFMVSNAAQLILFEEKEKGHDLNHLDQFVAVQINDTHPSLIIPELIRLLIKEGIPFKRAADIVANTCAYTNHTILAEALEKWPLSYLEQVVPQLTPIIGALDFGVTVAYHNNSALNIIDDQKRVHMANMDMHFGHSINGVAALHTEILKHQELRPFYDIYHQKFNNKTNGITFRRFIMHSNYELADLIDHLIGDDWHTNAASLEKLMKFYDNENVLSQIDAVKRMNKVRLAAMIKREKKIVVNPDSIFDIQIKRMHEYKRQQMNALWVIYKYLQIKNGVYPARPVTVIFGGKAAPAYVMAKNIIHLILCLEELINNDPEVSPYLKVVMIENYNVSKAEILVPGCDISEQISLASKEAAGTGNMKFMLNGAITLGTNDGANIEIKNLVGDQNFYSFGRSSDEVINLYNTNGYHSADFYHRSNSIHQCVDFIVSDELKSIGDADMLQALHDDLINKDWFMALLDLESYTAVKSTALADYEDRKAWKQKMLVNIAKAGYFSSDRTIEEYAEDIWKIKKLDI